MSTDVLNKWGIPAVITVGVVGMAAMGLSVSDSVCPIEEMRYWQPEKLIRYTRAIPSRLSENGFVGTKMPEPDSSNLAATLSRPEVLNGMIFYNATLDSKARLLMAESLKNERGGYPSCNRKLFRLYDSASQQTKDFIYSSQENKELDTAKLKQAIETNEKAWKELQRLDEKHYQGMLVGGYQE